MMRLLNRTKLWLSAALKELSLKKPLEKITVTDLTTHSGVNRGTFYYHFKDIQDLINWTYHVDVTLPARELLENITLSDITEYKVSASLLIMSNVYSSKEFYRQAIQIQGQNNLQEFMLKENTENWECLWNAVMHTNTAFLWDKKNVEYVLEYFGHAHHYALLHWIQTGMNEPPEEIAKIIDIASLRGFEGLVESCPANQ